VKPVFRKVLSAGAFTNLIRPEPRSGLPSTDQAGLPGDKPEVELVAVAAQLGKGQRALVDAAGSVSAVAAGISGEGNPVGRGRRFGYISLGRSDGAKFGLKGLLDPAGVVRG
jgi:hypothetical protein